MTATTVVIPALNAAATLPRQLAALHRQRSQTPFEVIVVDNGSDDATAEVALAFNAPDFPVNVVTEHKRGINHARNAGIRRSRAGIILLCDSDDEVHDGWVRALSTGVDDRHWATAQLDYIGLNSTRTRSIWGAAERSSHRDTKPYIDNSYGCGCGFATSMWSALGGFDVRLSGTGGDENEMFMRAHHAGYRVRWVPEAVVSYRLRPGVRGMVRQRYRQGRAQTRWEKLPGGAHLAGTMRPTQTVRRLAKLVFVAPLYALAPERRYAWLGAFARHLGRLVGWWKHRGWPSENVSAG